MALVRHLLKVEALVGSYQSERTKHKYLTTGVATCKTEKYFNASDNDFMSFFVLIVELSINLWNMIGAVHGIGWLESVGPMQ